MNLKEQYQKKANRLLGEDYEEPEEDVGAEEELPDDIEAVAQDAINALGSIYQSVSMQKGREDYAKAIEQTTRDLQKRFYEVTGGR